MERISSEWARQLAWDIYPGYIASTTLVTFVDDFIFSFLVPLAPDADLSVMPAWVDEVSYYRFGIEEINLISIHDPINHEITRLGFGPKSNLILVGTTRADQ